MFCRHGGLAPIIAFPLLGLSLTSPALAQNTGCRVAVDVITLGAAEIGGNPCKPFGTAPAKKPPPGGSRDAPGTYIGTTTPGPLKVAPVKVMSNAGDPIKQTGKPAVTRVMSNAGDPIKQTGKPAATQVMSNAGMPIRQTGRHGGP